MYKDTYMNISKMIPVEKINGMRFGQLIANAIMNSRNDLSKSGISTELFYIENEELLKLMEEYINGAQK